MENRDNVSPRSPWISGSPAVLSGFLQLIHHLAFTFFRRPKNYCNVTVMGGEVALP